MCAVLALDGDCPAGNARLLNVPSRGSARGKGSAPIRKNRDRMVRELMPWALVTRRPGRAATTPTDAFVICQEAIDWRDPPLVRRVNRLNMNPLSESQGSCRGKQLVPQVHETHGVRSHEATKLNMVELDLVNEANDMVAP